MSGITVEFSIEEPDWLSALPDFEKITREAVELALAGTELPARGLSISVLACNDARIAQLNAGFRDKTGATNVLSWPAADLSPETPGSIPHTPTGGLFPGPAPLGDVAIALQTCIAEANRAAKPLKNHVTHLILHGCLHLLGYDHQTPEDAALMEGIEIEALGSAGIPNPYS